ncbi:hypothetical protein Efla_006664 [Eimeria flavescens]
MQQQQQQQQQQQVNEGPPPAVNAAQQQQQQQPVHRVVLPRELLFKPILPAAVEGALGAPEGAPEGASGRLSLAEAAAKAVEAWVDPDAIAAAAAPAAAAAAGGEEVHGEGTDESLALTQAYRLSALFFFFWRRQADPLALEALGLCLPSLLRSAASALLSLLRGPRGRRRLKLSVLAAAEEAPAAAAAAAAPPAAAAAAATAAAGGAPAKAAAAAAAPSHIVYTLYALDFFKEFCLCLGAAPPGSPEGGPPGLPPSSASRAPLPLPAVAGVSFPLLAACKGGAPIPPPQAFEQEGAPSPGESSADPRGGEGHGSSPKRGGAPPLLDEVRLEEGAVCFYGRGFRLRILECIRSYVRAVSGREGYLSLVEATTRSEVPVHLKAVCLPGLVAAAAKIKRKRDRFITQLCSIAMSKTLPVRTPQHATASLAKLLPPLAKKVLHVPQKQQQQQRPQQQQQQQLISGSFPVFVVGAEVSLPVRLSLLAHATQALAVAVEAEGFRETAAAADTQQQQQQQQQQEDAAAAAAAAAEGDKEKGEKRDAVAAATEPLVALHAIQSVLFKALEVSVPLLADPFMGPPPAGPSPAHQQQQQHKEKDDWSSRCLSFIATAAASRACLSAAVSRVLSFPLAGGPLKAPTMSGPPKQQQQQLQQQEQQHVWTAEDLFLWAAADSLVRQAGFLLCQGEETLAYVLQRLNLCAAPQPQQGDLEVGPLASACLVYCLLILLLGGPSLPSPLCLSQRAVWALKAACIFMQHADAEAAAAAAAGTVRQQQQQQQQQKDHLAAAAEGAGIWREARWLLQRKAEQLLVFGVSLLPTVKQQLPQRFDTTHSLRAHPSLLLLLLLQQMASGATSAARGLLLLTQRGALPLTPEEEASLSSLGIVDSQEKVAAADAQQQQQQLQQQQQQQQRLAVRGGDFTLLYRCIAVLTGLFGWKEQISLFQSLLSPKGFLLADSACAAILILIKDRWCHQVLLQQQQQQQQQQEELLQQQQQQHHEEPAGDTDAGEVSETLTTGASAATAGGPVVAAQRAAAAEAAGAAEGAAAAADAVSLEELNLRMLAFVVQTQLVSRQEPIAEGSERLSCVLNWLKLVLLPGKQLTANSNSSSSSGNSTNPYYRMGRLLLKTHKQAVLGALRRLGSQVDAEEMIMQGGQGGPPSSAGSQGGGGAPHCLLPCAAPGTSADKIDLLRPRAGGPCSSNAATEQRLRLQLVCLVLQEVRELAHQAAAGE